LPEAQIRRASRAIYNADRGFRATGIPAAASILNLGFDIQTAMWLILPAKQVD